MTQSEFEAAIKPTPTHPISIDTQKAISILTLERDLWRERAKRAEETIRIIEYNRKVYEENRDMRICVALCAPCKQG